VSAPRRREMECRPPPGLMIENKVLTSKKRNGE
jgi:hypothetical protein